MKEQPPLSKNFFTKTPEKLDIYVGAYEPEMTSKRFAAFNEEYSENSREWFDLYYSALNAYTPKRQPHQPDALDSIVITPYSSPFDSKPLLAVSGRYVYNKATTKSYATINRPIVIAVETHGGHEDHLSYRSAFDEHETPIALPEPISVDIAKLMISYFRRPAMSRYDNSRGM